MTYFVVYSVLSQFESIQSAATPWNVGEQTPVHEDVPGEGVGGGDYGREHPQSKECQVQNTLIPEWKPIIWALRGRGREEGR